MYFLLDACQHPAVLRTLYFGMIIKDIVFTIIPIGIVLMTIIDFSKAVVAGKEDEQNKAVKLIPKRIMYAIIVFAIPWVVKILMKTLSDLKLNVAMDFDTCLKNAREAEGNFEYYDNLLAEEEKTEELRREAERNSASNNGDVPFPTVENTTIENVINNNIYQGDSKWGSHPLCTNKVKIKNGDNRTISSAGCGFCSLTMVLRTFGYNVTPDKIVDEICSGGRGSSGYAIPSDFVYIASKYGLKSKTYGRVNNSQAAKYDFTPLLKSGKRLIVNMPGHYISVLGIRSDGYLYVGDSARGFNKSGPYTMESLFDATTYESPYWLNVTAIWKD